jgi:hypothetical protein
MSFVLKNLEVVCSEISKRQELRPDSKQRAKVLGTKYKGSRGTMIVDVIGSRQRRYKSYVQPKIIKPYSEQRDGSLQDLAGNPPTFLKLREYEVPGMSEVAQALLDYGHANGLMNEEEICLSWANLPSIHDGAGAHEAVQTVLDVKGIGPALLEYLRMLCGANTLKVDVRVIKSLSEAGVPVQMFRDSGIYEVCRAIAHELELTMVELDSLLWLDGQ